VPLEVVRHGNPEQERRALVAAHVQRLISSPEWDLFLKEVDQIEHQALEQLATTTNPVFDQGILLGIRRMKSLPQTLIAQGRR